MLSRVLALTAVLLTFTASAQESAISVGKEAYPAVLFPSVRIETSLGDIVVELDRRRAPVTANHFLRHVEEGLYEGTVFHRVIPGFVVQGGGYLEGSMRGIDHLGPIINESGNGLKNETGTIAMARHSDPHTATSQFYFNLADNESLDPRRRNWGYTVFGKVLEGMDVVEAIAVVETDYNALIDSPDVPVEPVVLKRVQLIEN
jgi:peptidyl-prolyl cis-trans isomerase A (cyclophilin A)